MKMKKILSLLLAATLAFACASLFAFSSSAASDLTVTVTDPAAESAEAPGAVSWFQAGDGEWYFFLPSAISGNELKVWFDAESVTVDGAAAQSGQAVTLGETGTIACGGDSFDYHVLHSSGVAAVFINTESGDMEAVHADKAHKEPGMIKILDAKGKAEYDGKLDYIKGRGNASWQVEKKGYNIKLDKKTNLFKMGKSKKWCLIASHDDPSLLRNAVMYGAAKDMGLAYSPLYQPCDVYFNGQYNGSYLITTKIEADDNRIAVENLDDVNEDIVQAVLGEDVDMETLARGGVYGKFAGLLENTCKWIEIPDAPADYDEVDITGGYVLEMELANRYYDELSGFVTSRSQPFIMKCPEYGSEAQIAYISDYYQRFEDAVFAEEGKNAQGESYTDLADFDSLVNYYLISEWSSNMDSGLTSTYFYKDAGGKLFAGPVWDYDIALGNNGSKRFGCDYDNPEEFTVAFNRQYRNTVFGSWDVMEKPTIYNQLNQRQEFVEAAKANWDAGVGAVLGEWANSKLDAYALTITDSAVMNAVRWDRFGTTDLAKIRADYAAAVAEVKDFAVRRTAFLTANLGEIHQAPQSNLFEKAYRGVLTGVNTLFERFIVLFKLENK
ncbi:MAG: CotH kinase family protein [Clostridia bacterium]|nr:CotH kinase family protein [Clostridia bacterium]